MDINIITSEFYYIIYILSSIYIYIYSIVEPIKAIQLIIYLLFYYEQNFSLNFIIILENSWDFLEKNKKYNKY